MAAYSSIQDVPLFRYGMVMADPPWRHARWSDRGSNRAPDQHYSTMTMSDIKAIRVADFCPRDAWLWLWVPGCFADQGPAVLDAWGFQFVTFGFWGKITKSQPVRPAIGTGYVLREAGEPFIIGKIGNPAVLDRGIPSLILEPRREHSRKPEKAYQHAERMAPSAYRLDLFSRQKREGWDCMGDETDKFEPVTG